MSDELRQLLSQNGFNAKAKKPSHYGAQRGSATAGGLGVTVSSIKALFTGLRIIIGVVKYISGWFEKRAYEQRQEFLPNVIVRLEIEKEFYHSDEVQGITNRVRPSLDELYSAKRLVALLEELSTFMSAKYPLSRFEYLIIAPKGRRCFSVYIPDNLITNKNIMKIIQNLSSNKSVKWCSLRLVKKLGITKALFSKNDHSHYRPFNTHQASCEVPAYELTKLNKTFYLG